MHVFGVSLLSSLIEATSLVLLHRDLHFTMVFQMQTPPLERDNVSAAASSLFLTGTDMTRRVSFVM